MILKGINGLCTPTLCRVPDRCGFQQGADDKAALTCLSKGVWKRIVPWNHLSPGMAFLLVPLLNSLSTVTNLGSHKTPACMTCLVLNRSNSFDDYRECQMTILERNVQNEKNSELQLKRHKNFLLVGVCDCRSPSRLWEKVKRRESRLMSINSHKTSHKYYIPSCNKNSNWGM